MVPFDSFHVRCTDLKTRIAWSNFALLYQIKQLSQARILGNIVGFLFLVCYYFLERLFSQSSRHISHDGKWRVMWEVVEKESRLNVYAGIKHRMHPFPKQSFWFTQSSDCLFMAMAWSWFSSILIPLLTFASWAHKQPDASACMMKSSYPRSSACKHWQTWRRGEWNLFQTTSDTTISLVIM